MSHKLLVANRGEIAVRILRTARRLGLRTVAIYTRADATAPHVVLADEAAALRADDADDVSNAHGYLDADALLEVCKTRGVTLLHPGYGFLSENADFARKVVDAGVGWLGPRPETIEAMGLKHRARELALEVGVPLVPGSKTLLKDEEEAVRVADEMGYPVMLKSTAGGGGMGLVVCGSADDLRVKFPATAARAQSLFHNGGLFIEKYFPAARHIEVQVFGDGAGHAIHMGERECSVQRRHQKVIEESPSPFMLRHPDIRQRMCDAAVRLAEHVKYASAGTVEFLVDDETGDFYFLEMNTRLQVEHPVTEQVNPGLDIVELMILQGMRESTESSPFLSQDRYTKTPQLHALEVRLYCENPAAQFKPSPGVLQHVAFPTADWLRVDSWVETGTTITPHYDPLACKLIVVGASRTEAVERLCEAIAQTQVYGAPNNISFLRAICASDVFRAGNATTTFLDGFQFIPRAVTVLNGGLDTTVQDYPGRRIGLGIPRSGPMDPLAFRIANILVGNDHGVEGLEITLTGCRLQFHVAAVVAVTGAASKMTVDGQDSHMWRRLVVPAGGKLVIGPAKDTGMRTYLAIRGGFPEVPKYLGSKSTSMGLGGYQGRALTAGDHLALGDCGPLEEDGIPFAMPTELIPSHQSQWEICVLPGPHCDSSFVTSSGISALFSNKWSVSAASNRMGIRLEGGHIDWARAGQGDGGSHPSNILDNGYALGTVNVNGDTPVILAKEGPDMGGYACVCTIASAELWKLGQLRGGNTVRFKRITYKQATQLHEEQARFLGNLGRHSWTSDSPSTLSSTNHLADSFVDQDIDPILHQTLSATSGSRPGVTFRQAGDGAILVEFGEERLDLAIRARIHAFETEIRRCSIPGIWSLAPCIRSTMVHFDSSLIDQSTLLAALVTAESALPDSLSSLSFPSRRITFPIVLDDRWNRDALVRYMRSVRATAAYLPSNVEYLARNNGLAGADEALKALVGTDWLTLGVGFYLACPFLVPIDPRCRLVGQKMNPSRTFTPRGAIGIAGVVAAIYPIESPGGYQLYGRTLPPWQTWGKGRNFSLDCPWLLRPFDQLHFEVVSEEDYEQLESQFDAGQYVFTIEECAFSMDEYIAYIAPLEEQIRTFRDVQAHAAAAESQREHELFEEWDRQRRAEAEAKQSNSSQPVFPGPDAEASGDYVASSLTANVWKITCAPGDVIKSADHVLLVLEAMKTEISIEAGEEYVGRTVKGFGHGVREGAAVQAGQALVLFN